MDPATNKVFLDILDFDPKRKRINHLLKVTAYALAIAREENIPPETYEILHLAALLHDIGIKASLDRHGDSSHAHQQIEGPRIAAEILARHGFSLAVIERVGYLIAHHHEYDNIDGADYQILIEADFLVNLDEGNRELEAVVKVRDSFFRTATGISILNRMWDLQ